MWLWGDYDHIEQPQASLVLKLELLIPGYKTHYNTHFKQILKLCSGDHPQRRREPHTQHPHDEISVSTLVSRPTSVGDSLWVIEWHLFLVKSTRSISWLGVGCVQFCHRQSPIRADRSGSACRAHAVVSGLRELRGVTREMYCNPISTANVWRWNISRFGTARISFGTR